MNYFPFFPESGQLSPEPAMAVGKLMIEFVMVLTLCGIKSSLDVTLPLPKQGLMVKSVNNSSLMSSHRSAIENIFFEKTTQYELHKNITNYKIIYHMAIY